MRILSVIGIGLLCSACMSSGGTPSAAANNPVTSTGNDLISPAPQPASMDGMLEAHNQVRAEVAVMPLTWSGRMESYAQEWASHLANNNSCTMEHRSNLNQIGMGENLFWASPRVWSDGRVELQDVTPAQVALDWAGEKADYDYASNSCAPGKQCGHYTQMVWRSTTEVGCAMAVCPDKGQIWVCNYNPPGNYPGQQPY